MYYFIYNDIYYKELGHVIMEPDKSKHSVFLESTNTPGLQKADSTARLVGALNSLSAFQVFQIFELSSLEAAKHVTTWLER